MDHVGGTSGRGPTIVLGAGVAGLSAARLLARRGLALRLIEARARIGGRALSLPLGDAGAAADLGPAWIWPDQQHRLAALCSALNLRLHPQSEDGLFRHEDDSGSRTLAFPRRYADAARIGGGVGALASALARDIPAAALLIGAEAVGVSFDGSSGVVVALADGRRVSGAALVCALPPRLAAALAWSPALPPGLMAALAQTPTWMAAHAKALAVYDRPFWRAAGLSGAAASAIGPLSEIADHSAPDGSFHALFGFIGWPAEARGDTAQLEAAIRAQLCRLFGPQAAAPARLVVADWSAERFTAGPGDAAFPDGHPAYGHPLLARPAMGGRLAFAAAETSAVSGGLMEGAVLAGERAAASVAPPATPAEASPTRDLRAP